MYMTLNYERFFRNLNLSRITSQFSVSLAHAFKLWLKQIDEPRAFALPEENSDVQHDLEWQLTFPRLVPIICRQDNVRKGLESLQVSNYIYKSAFRLTRGTYLLFCRSITVESGHYCQVLSELTVWVICHSPSNWLGVSRLLKIEGAGDQCASVWKSCLTHWTCPTMFLSSESTVELKFPANSLI